MDSGSLHISADVSQINSEILQNFSTVTLQLKIDFPEIILGLLYRKAQIFLLWRFFSAFGATPINGNQVVAGQPGL